MLSSFKAKSQEIVDSAASEITEAEDAATEKIDVIVQVSNKQVQELKIQGKSQLQKIFGQDNSPVGDE